MTGIGLGIGVAAPRKIAGAPDTEGHETLTDQAGTALTTASEGAFDSLHVPAED